MNDVCSDGTSEHECQGGGYGPESKRLDLDMGNGLPYP